MKIAIMGCGVVGSGVYEIVRDMAGKLSKGCGGEEISVKYILDIKELDAEKSALQIRDIDIIANDPEVLIVVEAMGVTKQDFDFCLKCLNAGKSVVTSNKQLVAEKGEELLAAAEKNNVAFRFGASVCGGIPVIRTLFYGLAANEISSFAGILNGTSNFILTKMIKDKMTNAAALKLAQENGYAEKDPTDDIEGFDAARKTAILCSVCFGKHIYPDEIHTEGITGISDEDVEYVGSIGSKIKLIGRGEKLENGKIYASVAPAVIDEAQLISGVDGVFNALKVNGNKVGEVLLYGPGAGKDATASAVVADILDCIRKPGFDSVYSWENGTRNDVLKYDEYETALYVRGYVKDKNKAVCAFREMLDGVRFLSRENAPENEIAFITEKKKEKDIKNAVDSVDGFTAASIIRIIND
ncbi:MAG: homoserine dehydrogenase [Clostridia bacterium]|nr:homoserine dehydrogenase [Clostridia bacterium]